ncbi:MAG: rhodanese [Planctomycetaceae bacterium]|nr:rhodanese [Planctomycetaceae bacterium]
MSESIEIDCSSVRGLLAEKADFLLLDCREQQEYDTARIDGATLVPMSELRDRVSELEEHRQRSIVVYCHHGARSLRVAGWLRQQGFGDVRSLSGGIDCWSTEIDPSVPRY